MKLIYIIIVVALTATTMVLSDSYTICKKTELNKPCKPFKAVDILELLE